MLLNMNPFVLRQSLSPCVRSLMLAKDCMRKYGKHLQEIEIEIIVQFITLLTINFGVK